jgi:hypothetical protein
MKNGNLAIQLAITFLLYLFLGIIGLVGFLSEPSVAATWLYFITLGLVTAGVAKVTDCRGFTPGLSKWVDDYAECGLYGIAALCAVFLLFNGYMPVRTFDLIKLW